MTRIHSKWLSLPATAGLLAFAVAPIFAQAPAQPTGKIHGHITNPTGAPQTSGNISLSNDGGHTNKYTFPVNAQGDYSGEAVAGKYTLIFRQPETPPDKMVDSIENVTVVAGQDTQVDDDMTRQAFIDKLPEDQKKQVEELRKHNSEALKANEVIKHLNADLATVGADMKAADTARAEAQQELGASATKQALDAKEAEIRSAKYGEVESLMQKDTAAKPDATILWARLGQAQAGLKKYDDAETSFKKVLELESTAKKPSPEVQGLAHAGLGEVYARTGKTQQAQDEYDAAAKANPTQAPFYLKNEAVIFFQSNNSDAQVAAANKAIALDPNSPNAAILYYLKGNGLVAKTTEDPKTHKLVPPAGCMEAYQKYLELAPNGPYAGEVKGILAGFNQTIDTTYKAGKKK